MKTIAFINRKRGHINAEQFKKSEEASIQQMVGIFKDHSNIIIGYFENTCKNA